MLVWFYLSVLHVSCDKCTVHTESIIPGVKLRFSYFWLVLMLSYLPCCTAVNWLG